jgi:hypothetical protein
VINEHAGPDATAPALLRLESGDPTDEELAALVAVVAARAARSTSPGRGRQSRSAWANPARSVRQTHRHGPGEWRASVLPR